MTDHASVPNNPLLAEFRQRATRSKRLSPEILSESDAALIDKLHLLEGDYLKRAAVLLFHPDPERFVTGAFVKIGYFRSNADLLYQDDVHGDLFSQVDRTLDLLLTKYLKALISYQGVQRVGTYPVPEEALREAVLNAIAHKDYASGIPIQIRVYDERIMLWNPAQLPPEWTVEKLTEEHASRPYNPDVANAFFRVGMVEAWGRGIEGILKACKAASIPTPQLRYADAGLRVEFAYRAKKARAGKESGATRKTTQKATQKTARKILTIIRQTRPPADERLPPSLGTLRKTE